MDDTGTHIYHARGIEADKLACDPQLPRWDGRAILLVDLDAFFASVEQLDHPEWRGKPVIVGGDASRRGVVSTASYEARVYGVHSAMPAARAAKLCPHAIWTSGRFDRYREMSNQVMSILLDESPLLQQVSIDEAFLDVSPGRYANEHPVSIANRIRMRVRTLGVTCSVGVSTSKTVSKIASDQDKPDGMTVVFPGSEEAFLAPLPVKALSGIGAKTEKRLHALGVTTLGQIARGDADVLKPLFGKNTEKTMLRCAGVDPAPIVTEREAKQVSNEMTFAEDLLGYEEIRDAVAVIAGKVGRRLRRKGLYGSTVALKLRLSDLSIHTAQHAIGQHTDDERVFAPIAEQLIRTLWRPGVRVRLVGVSVSGFGEHEEQLSLFSSDTFDTSAGASDALAAPSDIDADASQAHRRLLEATDRVKERYGDDAVTFGRNLRFRNRDTGTKPQNKDDDS